jgi:hypothetical protein
VSWMFVTGNFILKLILHFIFFCVELTSLCVCLMQSQSAGCQNKQCAVSLPWPCDLECCTGHHTEYDLQWRYNSATTSLFAELWLWRSLEVCRSFYKGNCSCLKLNIKVPNHINIDQNVHLSKRVTDVLELETVPVKCLCRGRVW